MLWEARLKDVVKGLDRVRGLLRAVRKDKDRCPDTLDPHLPWPVIQGSRAVAQHPPYPVLSVDIDKYCSLWG